MSPSELENILKCNWKLSNLKNFLGKIYHKDMHHGPQSSSELENFFANLTHYSKVYSVSSFHTVQGAV